MTARHSLLVVCLALSGCLPVKMQVGKHIDGRLVSKDTGVPISRAQVMFRHKSSTAVLTDTNGTFAIERQFVIYWRPLLPVDYFGYYHYPLTIRAQGYKKAAYRPTAQPKPESVRIELEPSP